ncbi:MAG: DUF3307 domain-containing protein [Elusimicrobiota bacterium]
MLVFWRLLFGHLLADFTLQSDSINRWKRSSLLGMFFHCATHPFCYAILTWNYLGQTWIRVFSTNIPGWSCLLIVFAAHWIEDEWRVFTIFRYHTPDNTAYFIWDQIIHYVVLAAMIPLGAISSGGGFMPEKWPVLGCLFVLATHASTVLIYFIEKDIDGSQFPRFREKYWGMCERLALALCVFAAPQPLNFILAAAWIALAAYTRVAAKIDLSRLNLILGSSAAVVCGLAGRFVYHL